MTLIDGTSGRLTDGTLEQLAKAVGHVLLGTVGTAIAGVGLLWALQPLQAPIYHAFYLAVGPWTATVTATVLAFTLVGVLAISLPTLLSVHTRSRFEHLGTLVAGLAGLLGLLLVGLSATAFVGAIGFLAAVAAFALFVVGVPLGLRYSGAWPDGVTAFVGGLPVLVLLLLLLGFGLGWGGGLVVVAQEVPASEVDGTADASFADQPTLREDLLGPAGGNVAASCEQDADGRRRCRLHLRGYEHEVRAARFLDRHGVRCPFPNAPAGQQAPGKQSFLAEDGGTYYRVSCHAYGN